MKAILVLLALFVSFQSLAEQSVQPTPEMIKEFEGLREETLPFVKGDIAAIEKSLKSGYDVNKKVNYVHETPLTLAAMNGRAKAVEFLLQKGAEVNHQLKGSKFTALMFAAQGGSKLTIESSDYVQTVAILLKRGAQKDLKNREGKTALDLAKEAHNDKIAAMLK